MEEKSGLRVVGVKIKVVDALGIKCRSSTNEAMDFISLCQ